jgi:hypothetical protein
VTEPTHPRPVDPAELGFERIVYEKAPPRATIRLDRPDVLNAFDFRMLREIARACEDASWDDDIRAVVVTGTGAGVLRRCRPSLVGRGPPRELERVLEVVRRLQGHARPAARDRQADDRARERDRVGGGNELQMACDLAVMVDTRVHPPRRAPARLGAGGRRDAVAAADGRRPSRAGDRLPLRRDPARAGGGVGARQPRGAGGGARRVVDEWVEKLARALPQTTRYAKQQLNVWRDLAWHQTVGHARDWLAMSMLGSEAQDAVRAFLERGKE